MHGRDEKCVVIPARTLTCALVHIRIPLGPAIAGWFFFELYTREDGWISRVTACVTGVLSYAPYALVIGGIMGPGIMGINNYPGIWPVLCAFGITGLFLAPHLLSLRPERSTVLVSLIAGLIGTRIEAITATGPFGSLVTKVSLTFGILLARLLSGFLVAIGCAIFVTIIQGQRSKRLGFMLNAVLLIPLFLRSFWFERYTLPIIALLLTFLPAPMGRRRFAVYGWVMLWCVLSGAQTLRWMGRAPELKRWPASLENTLRAPWTGVHGTLDAITDPSRNDPRDNLHSRLVDEARRAEGFLALRGGSPTGPALNPRQPSPDERTGQ